MDTNLIEQVAAEVTGRPSAHPSTHEQKLVKRVAKALQLLLAGQVECVNAAADIWRVRGHEGIYTVQDGRCNCRFYQEKPHAAPWSCCHSMAVFILREATYRQTHAPTAVAA